jgi:adenylosuccinate synthase
MKHAFLTLDLGFGDAGKGSVVDFLTRAFDAHTVIRFNGGAQAGHRVVTDEAAPREHVFAQFGSGTLAGAATHLSRFMLLEPLAMMAEEQHLQTLGVADAFERTTIDDHALVITPFQQAVNRLRELARGDGRHGSCGMGIGETMSDALAHGQQALFAGDLTDRDRLYAKLSFLQAANRAKIEPLLASLPITEAVAGELAWLTGADWADWLLEAYAGFTRRLRIAAGETLMGDILQRPGAVVFEAAQGVLLDEWYGFHPYTTWSTTTLANADRLLAEASYAGSITRIGITRAYATRHGPGPFASEDAHLTQALPDAANTFGPWQRDFRVGWPDAVMLRYGREIAGPLDMLAVTCLDRLASLPALKLCAGYRCGVLSVDRILPSPRPQDLGYQEQITRHLAQCEPVLEDVAGIEDLLQRFTRAASCPVGLVSYGPTAAGKSILGMNIGRGYDCGQPLSIIPDNGIQPAYAPL